MHTRTHVRAHTHAHAHAHTYARAHTRMHAFTHAGLQNQVAKTIQKQSQDDSLAGGPLEGLQGAIADQLRAMRSRVENDLVPRPFLESELGMLKRRFADLEWKMLRRRNDGIDADDDQMNLNRYICVYVCVCARVLTLRSLLKVEHRMLKQHL